DDSSRVRVPHRARSAQRGAADHRPGGSVYSDRDKAVRLVQAARGIAGGDTETQAWVSLSNARLDEVSEEPSSNTFVPTGRDDGDRQFGTVLTDEAMPMARFREPPVPGRAHWSVLFGNQSIVALSWPSGEVHRVARIGEHLRSSRCVFVGPP